MADIAEFCGRIRAGKDAQTDEDFCIVARTEALISGHSMDEALRRAEAYHAAGADAILIHSKRSDAGEIVGFMRRWDRPLPGGDRADHVLRDADRRVPRGRRLDGDLGQPHGARLDLRHARRRHAIAEANSLMEVEDRVASVRDIFKLTGNDELEEASPALSAGRRCARCARGAGGLARGRAWAT